MMDKNFVTILVSQAPHSNLVKWYIDEGGAILSAAEVESSERPVLFLPAVDSDHATALAAEITAFVSAVAIRASCLPECRLTVSVEEEGGNTCRTAYEVHIDDIRVIVEICGPSWSYHGGRALFERLGQRDINWAQENRDLLVKTLRVFANVESMSMAVVKAITAFNQASHQGKEQQVVH